jgi:hypothetical protein
LALDRCALRLQDLPDEGAGVHEPLEVADPRQKQFPSGLICKTARETHVFRGFLR